MKKLVMLAPVLLLAGCFTEGMIPVTPAKRKKEYDD